MNSNLLAEIEKLTGSTNYNDWKFAITAYLQHENLWKYVEGKEATAANLEDQNVIKARSKLRLSVDKSVYSYITEANTPKEIWDKLKEAFEDSGLTNKVSLLRILITTKLDECKDVDEYINRIFTTSHKLSSLKFTVSQEWLGVILLAGLPEQYKPMVMALENSGTPITGDAIKVKLLN